MKTKYLVIDTETYGLYSYKHDLREVTAILLNEDREVVETFESGLLAPTSKDRVDMQALLDVHGLRDIPELGEDGYGENKFAFERFLEFLDKNCNRMNKDDKFILVAHNARFDEEFIRYWFKMNGNKFYGSYFYNSPICTQYSFSLAANAKLRNILPNFKLSTLCSYLGVETRDLYGSLHTATYDANLCARLFKQLHGTFTFVPKQ